MIPMMLKEAALAVDATCDPGYERLEIRRVTTDSRDVKEGDLFFAIVGPRFDGHGFVAQAAEKGAIACVCNAGVRQPGDTSSARPIPCLEVADTTEALGKLAAHYRRKVMPDSTVVVAVTGTNGKTTTKSMIDHVLGDSFQGTAAPRSFNNHIGVPLTLLSSSAEDRYLVVEIGSNSPGEVDCLAAITAPDAAVITSIGEAHLQGLGSIEGVIAEKLSLLKHVTSRGLAVVNIDRPEVLPRLSGVTRSRLLTVGSNPAANLSVTNAGGDIRGTHFELTGGFRIELPMPGLHHATNAAAVFAVARWFGIAPDKIADRLRTYQTLPGRSHTLDLNGYMLVDDSYNANPASMSAAIETLAGHGVKRRIFVMGDMLELGRDSIKYHRRAVEHVFSEGIEVLVAVGPATTEAARSIADRQASTLVVCCQGASTVSDALAPLLRAGDTIWIKGSRAMQLDLVVNEMKVRLGVQTAVA